MDGKCVAGHGTVDALRDTGATLQPNGARRQDCRDGVVDCQVADGMNLDTAIGRIGGDTGLTGEDANPARDGSDSDGIPIIEVNRSAGRGENVRVVDCFTEIDESIRLGRHVRGGDNTRRILGNTGVALQPHRAGDERRGDDLVDRQCCRGMQFDALVGGSGGDANDLLIHADTGGDGADGE